MINGSKGQGQGNNNFEDDKRKRRAIANSNERRRMQSINAGFQTLKSLIPHSSGEKLSKVRVFFMFFLDIFEKNFFGGFKTVFFVQNCLETLILTALARVFLLVLKNIFGFRSYIFYG
jgi:hypothetical protein